jgi:hypothetical protein
VTKTANNTAAQSSLHTALTSVSASPVANQDVTTWTNGSSAASQTVTVNVSGPTGVVRRSIVVISPTRHQETTTFRICAACHPG